MNRRKFMRRAALSSAAAAVPASAARDRVRTVEACRTLPPGRRATTGRPLRMSTVLKPGTWMG